MQMITDWCQPRKKRAPALATFCFPQNIYPASAKVTPLLLGCHGRRAQLGIGHLAYLHALGSWVANRTQCSHVTLGRKREENV